MPVSKSTCQEIFQYEANHPEASTIEISDATGWAKKTIYNCRSKFEPGNLLGVELKEKNNSHKEIHPSKIIEKKKQEYKNQEKNITLNLPTRSIENAREAKLAFGDFHLTDEDVMLSSIRSTIDNVIAYLQERDYELLEIINIGDTVSGTSIFHGQETRNLTNTPHWQTTAAAIFLRDFFERILEETSIQDIDIHILKGNHDQASKNKETNLAYYLVREMQALGMPDTEYEGEHYISDSIYCVHGFGTSDYRPQSPKFLRTLQKRAHNVNEKEDREIRRILHGHNHWAEPDFPYTLTISFDCLGGFQRNKRADLGRLQRPAGFILYEKRKEVWENKKRWKPLLIPPNKDVFWDEAEQTDLEFQNVKRIGELLQRSYEIRAE